ncbi:hypothetical protein Ais01nite_67720 [Asanoa ishikariensis]|uniref:hypothetical protein n=1 Tax=Asanoa ishikariensis TaxID=137265 RepID=UPI000A8442BB|nr:hypothetical protein [Asanoa ishikariensis]GIF68737.1 hypothetical protein Ais01nite_67720 [Asanoa ishikariensis]
MTLEGWRLAQQNQILDSGRCPLLATIPAETAADLDGLFEYGLARHLDGFAVLVEHS